MDRPARVAGRRARNENRRHKPGGSCAGLRLRFSFLARPPAAARSSDLGEPPRIPAAPFVLTLPSCSLFLRALCALLCSGLRQAPSPSTRRSSFRGFGCERRAALVLVFYPSMRACTQPPETVQSRAEPTAAVPSS